MIHDSPIIFQKSAHMKVSTTYSKMCLKIKNVIYTKTVFMSYTFRLESRNSENRRHKIEHQYRGVVIGTINERKN